MSSATDSSQPGLISCSKSWFSSGLFWVLVVLYSMTKCITMIFAGYLSWKCVTYKDNAKIMYVTIAILFSNLYIPYYILEKYILKHPC